MGPGLRYLTLTFSIVRDGSFATDSYIGLQSADIAFYNSHYYLAAQPGSSFLAVPLYAIIHLFSNIFSLPEKRELIISSLAISFFINSLPVSYCGVLFHRIARKFTETNEETAAAAFAFCFGTIIFAYATDLMMGESLAMVFCWIAFCFFLIKNSRPMLLRLSRPARRWDWLS